jgi:hypothetical protein
MSIPTRKLHIESAARRFAVEHHINGEKRESFIEGAKWLARWMSGVADHGSLAKGMAGADTLKMLDKLSLKEIRGQLEVLLSWEDMEHDKD